MRSGRPALNLINLLEAVTATAFSARSAPSGVMVEQAARLADAITARLRRLSEEVFIVVFLLNCRAKQIFIGAKNGHVC